MKHTSCDCPAGAGGKCKHICALIYYINNEENTSKTDLPQQWGKPSKVSELKYKKGKTIEELFPRKKQKTAIGVVEPLSHEDLISKHNILNIPSSFSKLLKEESLTTIERECKQILNNVIVQVEQSITHSLNKKIFSTIILKQNKQFTNNIFFIKFPLNFKENEFYINNIALSSETCLNIYNETMAQSLSDTWKACRHFRISASVKAHKIKTCKDWTSFGLNKFADTLIKETTLGKTGSINVKYGQETEPVAFEKYQELNEVEVLKAGLVIHCKTPWVCASPDGLVLQKGEINKILEIKCPISCKNKQLIENNVPNLKYLHIVKGKIELKRSSLYYTQIQLLMYCSGLKFCDLFIYNNIKPILLTINQNNAFMSSLLPKIEYFYFNFYLPKLAKGI